jgi:GAF domain-containing protein
MRRHDSVERLQSLQNAILESIARGEELAAIMTALCKRVEALASGVVCSVVTIDDDFRLRPLAAPSLPRAYGEAVDGTPIGPRVGSCGTAIYRKSPVEVTDIATDPHWADYRELVLPLGLNACWSSPIAAKDGRIVGSFAFYYREPRGPTLFERRIVKTACISAPSRSSTRRSRPAITISPISTL